MHGGHSITTTIVDRNTFNDDRMNAIRTAAIECSNVSPPPKCYLCRNTLLE